MSKKKVEAEIKEEVKAVEEVAAEEVKETKEEVVKAPKKTKAELNKEMKAAIAEENASRTDRTRAEKAARREAKASRKEAKIVEEKKRRIGNGLLAILIFGIIALMFLFVWGYNYFSKEASIESYIANNGGTETYSNLPLSATQTMSVTAEKNNMTVLFDCKSKDEAKAYKGEDGEKQLKFMAAYYLGTMKPEVRGFSANAHCVVKLNGKEYTTADVKWSEVEDILEENGIHLEDLHHDHDHEHEHAHTETETEE